MSQTYTSPDDWLLTHHARDFSNLNHKPTFPRDHSVPIDTLFRSRTSGRNPSRSHDSLLQPESNSSTPRAGSRRTKSSSFNHRSQLGLN